jgi:hypothetical protein
MIGSITYQLIPTTLQAALFVKASQAATERSKCP